MLPELNELIQSKAEPVEVSGNQRLYIHDTGSVWFVERGQVDLFYILGPEGQGRLNHLLRAEPGNCLFGLAPGRKHLHFLVLGVGDVRLKRIPRKVLLEARTSLGDTLATLIDTWLDALTGPLFSERLPKKNLQFFPGDDLAIEEESTIVPKSAVAWIKPDQGEAVFMDQVSRSEFLPLTRHTCARVFKDSVVRTWDTRHFLAEAPFSQTLDHFHQVLPDFIERQRREQEDSERERIGNKIRNDRRLVEQVYGDFAGLLEKEKGIAHSPDKTQPLFAACELVASVMDIKLDKEVLGELGQSPDPLGAILRASGIRSREVMLTDGWWCSDSGPLLAYLGKDKRPVALLPKSVTRYELVDPIEETGITVDETVVASIEPRAVMFYRPLPDKKLTMSDLLAYGRKGLARELFMIVLTGVLGGLMGLMTPFATGLIFDQIIPEAGRNDLVFVVMGLLMVGLANMLFSLTRGFALLRLEGKVDASLQAAVWDRILSLPVPFFREYSSGDLVMRAMGIDRMRRMLSGTVVTSLISSSFSVFYFFQLFYYSWQMAMVALGLVFLAVLPLGLSLMKIKFERKVNALDGKLNGLTLEIIRGMSKLRVSGSETRAFAIWANPFREKKELAFKAGLIESVVASWNATFTLLSLIVIFAFMRYLLNNDQGISLGDFLAFNAAFTLLLASALLLSRTFVSLLTIIPTYERVKPILQTLPENTGGAGQPGLLNGSVDVSTLSFRYSPGGPQILKNITFTIEPGQFIALVGPSGSGKSTLFRMLLGFETPESGAVYYDGQELAGLDVKAVRRQVGVVLQNGKLMPGTIFENIVGSLPLTQKDAWVAASMAGLDRDIKEMPMGLHTLISETGGTLSGGQVQRLLIARALANKPRILLFDEATSALDNQTQKVVTESLDKLRITRVVIAHRLSTIKNADRIFVVEKGELVESGNYEKLMALDGTFAELARRQIA